VMVGCPVTRALGGQQPEHQELEDHAVDLTSNLHHLCTRKPHCTQDRGRTHKFVSRGSLFLCNLIYTAEACQYVEYGLQAVWSSDNLPMLLCIFPKLVQEWPHEPYTTLHGMSAGTCSCLVQPATLYFFMLAITFISASEFPKLMKPRWPNRTVTVRLDCCSERISE